MSSEEPEEWVPLEGYSGFEISSAGQIRGPNGLISGTILSTGYIQVSIRGDRHALHRLVCKTFNGAPLRGEYALHKDHDKQNNHKDNLYWGTHKDNMRDMVQAGRSTRNKAPQVAKLTEQDVLDIRTRLNQGECYKALMCEYDIQHPTMYNIRHYKSWAWVRPREEF